MKTLNIFATILLLLPTLAVAPDPTEPSKDDNKKKPEKIEWAEPGKLAIVPSASWDALETALHLKTDDDKIIYSPVLWLRMVSRRFIILSTEATDMFSSLTSIPGDPYKIAGTYLEDFEKILLPLWNYKYEGGLEGGRPAVLTESLINYKTDDTLEESVSTLKKLFDYDDGDVGNSGLIYLSDGPFLHAWNAMRTAYDELQKFLVQVRKGDKDTLRRLAKDYAKKSKTGKKPRDTQVDLPSLKIGVYDRQRLGITDYFDEKFRDFVHPMGEVASKVWMKSIEDAAPVGYPRMLLVVDAAEMILNALIGALAFMLEMMADIALEANAIGAKSVALPDPLWAMLDREAEKIPDLKRPMPKGYKPPKNIRLPVTKDILRKHPEWSDGKYVAEFPEHKAPLKLVSVKKGDEEEEKISTMVDVDKEVQGNDVRTEIGDETIPIQDIDDEKIPVHDTP